MSKLKLLDLFSGIGGFSLGLERTGGFETVAFCEIEDFPRKVLAKHWPEVPCYDDVRTLTAESLQRDGIRVDAICGGFPCQDISTAGKGAGIEGERSGLWREYARLIGELRPQVIFVENVAALLSRGLDRVLGDLAALRYDAEWHCIPASAVGAPHRRDRLWLVAYSDSYGALGEGRYGNCGNGERNTAPEVQERQDELIGSECAGSQTMANANSERQLQPCGLEQEGGGRSGDGREVLAYAMRERPSRQGRTLNASNSAPEIYREIYRALNDCRWSPEPNVGRVANGVPDRVHRLKALGNAVVPQIPELLGNAYLESIGWSAAA